MLTAMELCEPSTESQWQQYYDLRQRVFGVMPGHTAEMLRDGLEEDSFHLMALEADHCVGVGRVHFNHAAEGQVRYMAVDADFRGHGIGLAILQRLEIYLLRHTTETAVLEAHSAAVGFYQKHGYVPVENDQAAARNGRCVKMRKRLIR